MQHKTGEKAPARGVYHSNCRCRTELAVRMGDRFPMCSSCKQAVVWFFMRYHMSGEPIGPHPPSDAGTTPLEGGGLLRGRPAVRVIAIRHRAVRGAGFSAQPGSSCRKSSRCIVVRLACFVMPRRWART